jgi:hypothetical protein
MQERLTVYTDAAWLQWRYLHSVRRHAVLTVARPTGLAALAIARTATNTVSDGSDLLYAYLMKVIRASSAPLNAVIEAARAGVA